MKATLLTSAIALCALTAFAADQQTTAAQQQQTAPAEKQAATQAVQQQISAPVQAGDSPLVAAAKRTGRLGKKPTSVITNDTLLKSGGHFTTTKSQEALPEAKTASSAAAETASKPISTEDKPAQATNAAPAKKAEPAKEKHKKETAVRHAVADYEGATVEPVNDDPATQEGVIRDGVAPKPAEPAKPAAPRPPSE